MRFDYGTQISPQPIKLSIGTLKKPTLLEISSPDITFEKFNFYEVFTKISPQIYYEKISTDNSFWDSLNDKDRENLSMYTVIKNDEKVRNIFLDIFNFFFVEKVIYKEGFFVLLKDENDSGEEIVAEKIRGVIQEKTFSQVLDMIQQVCCIYNPEEEPIENLKFKNDKARKNYLKILNAQKQCKIKQKNDVNLSIPNIISSINGKHLSLNYTNIWSLTVFQLLDTFSRMQANAIYDIDSARVSAWGDEKKTFDAALWYKNIYDKK